MPHFKPFVDGRIVIVRWLEPSPEGARALSHLIERTHAGCGEPIFFAGIISAGCPTPSGDDRRALTLEHERIADRLLSARTVVLGRSFRQSLMRSVMTNILMIASRKGRGFVIDGSVGELAHAAKELAGVEPRWLVARLLDVGVLVPDEVEAALLPTT